MALKKSLGFIDVFSIAAGAMISSGIFILPGVAFGKVGPILFISYLIAGLFAMLGALSVVELSTAMPRAGGVYYVVNRSLGPLAGTLLGVFSWVAIALKSAFAIFGMAEVLFLLAGIPVLPSALAMTVLFAALNAFGAEKAARIEVILVLFLLLIMVAYVVLGMPRVDVARFDPMAPFGFNAILVTAGFVFVSFGGLVSVASIAEEVKVPTRNIPLGLLAALGVVTGLYVLLLIVTVGVLPAEVFRGSLTPVADSARVFAGKPGYVIISVAASLAFITTAISGIMSASRFPLALARDGLAPEVLGRVTRTRGVPLLALSLTAVFIGVMLLLPLETLVKAASTVILTANLFANLSVIILRESRLQNYQPTFRAPFYPWLQIASILLFGFFIVDMGLATIEISLALLGAALLVYALYGRRRGRRESALAHLVARLTNRVMRTGTLEAELREIIQQRDDVEPDWFDHLVKDAPVIDWTCEEGRAAFFERVAAEFGQTLQCKSEVIARLLEEREAESSTALSSFVAIPHIVMDGEGEFRLLVARCADGIAFAPGSPAVRAVFVLLGTKDTRMLHLRALAAIAQTVSEEHFEEAWLAASSPARLRDLSLLSKRRRQSST